MLNHSYIDRFFYLGDTMDKCLELFKTYIDDNYDLNNPLTKEKYFHTLRVVNLMRDLVCRLDLSEDEKRIAIFIALFHDLGRFYEGKVNKKFTNVNYDHASVSNDILFKEGFIKNFPIKESEYEIIKKAIYYHNKFEIGDELNPTEKLFAMYIRDVDKIDILKVVSNHHYEFNVMPNQKLLDNFYNQEAIDVRDIHSSSDSVVFYFSFYYQLYTTEALDILIEKDYMNDFIYDVKVSKDDEIGKAYEDMVERCVYDMAYNKIKYMKI